MHPEQLLSRRRLIIGGGALAATIAFGAHKLTEQHSFSPLDITGRFPVERFSFNETIVNHGLVPTVLPENQWGLDRMQAGVDYLKRTLEALKEKPEINIATLGDIAAVSTDYFPIEFSKDTTSSDVLESFLTDIENKNVILWGGSMSDVPYLVGTINNPAYKEGVGWHMEGQIHANAGFPFGPTRKEERETSYSRYTDVQVGLKMAHEYSHYRQGLMLMQLVLEEHGDAVLKSGNDVSYISKLIDAKVDDVLTTLGQDQRIDQRIITGDVAFNEAQANQISQLILWTINKLNDGNRMPGTEDDSYPESPGSLYRTFQRAIVQDKNPFDTNWLALHTNWGV